MAAYNWDTLKWQWEHAKLSAEQMMGQLLQWGELTHQQSIANQRQLEALERQVLALTARMTVLEQRALPPNVPK
ncbi:MAG: hypothetical protein U0350_48375 [Caldilineaceae bacterium]